MNHCKITSLGAFFVVSDTLKFLEESKKKSSEHETKSREREVQVRGLQMERSRELLEFLNTLIITSQENTIILNKATLQSMMTFCKRQKIKLDFFKRNPNY
jgi:hypothetical protein